MINIELTLNSKPVSRSVSPRATLADFPREDCNLTALHLGCEHGACGSCTVLLEGRPCRSCLILAPMVHGRSVETLEGLRNDPVMVLLRRHFHASHALQSGFCTPGMLVTARDILLRHTPLTELVIRQELAGQICRCTGYVNIVNAIAAAGAERATSS